MSKSLLNLLLITLSIFFYFVIISPIYFGNGYVYKVPRTNSITYLSEFKNKNDLALKQLTEGTTTINLLKKEYSSIDEKTHNDLNVMLPSGINPIVLVSEVSSIITDLGLPVENISYTKEIEDKKLPEVGVYSISFSTKCNYFNLKNLITKLEKSMRFFTVQSVSFSTGSNLDDSMLVNIKMNTYYIK